MTDWLPFPALKPTDEKGDFIVLSPNPNYINKPFVKQTTPKYHSLAALWTHGRFVNYQLQELVVDYYIQLPPFPEN